jgi:hypothetical protein
MIQICLLFSCEGLSASASSIVACVQTTVCHWKDRKDNPISSMPDHATQEAGIASRCESILNLLGQPAT